MTVSVSVMEGDSVTLYTDVETIQQVEIRWYFNDIHIAAISGDPNKTCTDVQCCYGTERFRDRLKLDHQTGSLTITNITTTDSGLLKLQINSSSDSLLQLFSVSVYDVPERQKIKSVKEGDAVTLDPGVVKKTNYLMKWLFNDVRIAEINGDLSFICADVQCLYADVRFRDRLKLNHITASLTITNTRTTDSGLYYLLITTIRFNIIKSFIVNVTGYVDAVSVSVMEGDSVTLYTDVETIQQVEIRWYFNDIHIAAISGDPNKTCTDVQCCYGTERFRDRLKLDHQTGSLTITNIRTTDYGLFKLQINSRSDSLLQLFSVSVYDVPERQKIKSVKEGDAVTLDPGVVKKTNYLMKWLFNDVRIAEINGDLSFICADVQCLYADVRFRDRLKLNHITGSLTITNTRTTDSGLYYLLITSIRFNIIKSFIVNVTGYVDAASVSVMEGDSVTLYTDVKTNQQEEIRWYFNDIRIAQITEDLSFICADVQCTYSDERFRDRLELDHQTGSLTITNTRTTDSGVYHKQVISGSNINNGIFGVTVYKVPDAE
ncbi:uncharacterized protein LOC109046438 [Cyprinus carpio]|uniref:Uncharacterized protein LOC109046438 n=1 Tax=Cyprinus carpio TaxID=7962 RepID=A0A9Q9VNG5_CYPCA|nr:uncharacterized protein LOC109046438 [Cyprinus carpio]